MVLTMDISINKQNELCLVHKTPLLVQSFVYNVANDSLSCLHLGFMRGLIQSGLFAYEYMRQTTVTRPRGPYLLQARDRSMKNLVRNTNL